MPESEIFPATSSPRAQICGDPTQLRGLYSRHRSMVKLVVTPPFRPILIMLLPCFSEDGYACPSAPAEAEDKHENDMPPPCKFLLEHLNGIFPESCLPNQCRGALRSKCSLAYYVRHGFSVVWALSWQISKVAETGPSCSRPVQNERSRCES